MKTSRTYMFNGSSKFIEIKNGVISTNYSINLFEGSDISYINKDDYNVTKYKIGYYVKINGKYKKFAVIENKDNDGLSLKGLSLDYKLKYNSIYHLALQTKKELDDLAEEMRVFYVATTRPQKELVIVDTIESIEDFYSPFIHFSHQFSYNNHYYT